MAFRSSRTLPVSKFATCKFASEQARNLNKPNQEGYNTLKRQSHPTGSLSAARGGPALSPVSPCSATRERAIRLSRPRPAGREQLQRPFRVLSDKGHQRLVSPNGIRVHDVRKEQLRVYSNPSHRQLLKSLLFFDTWLLRAFCFDILPKCIDCSDRTFFLDPETAFWETENRQRRLRRQCCKHLADRFIPNRKAKSKSQVFIVRYFAKWWRVSFRWVLRWLLRVPTFPQKTGSAIHVEYGKRWADAEKGDGSYGKDGAVSRTKTSDSLLNQERDILWSMGLGQFF